MDLGDLADLTADIRDNGLIEPLVVIPGSYGRGHGLCGDCDQDVPRHGSGVLAEHVVDGRPCAGGAEPAADDWYVVAGHRRRQASLDAGVHDVPCVTRYDLRTRADVIALMLRENSHRRDLTPLEEAQGFHQLTLEGLTATRIAQQVKRSKKTVDRRLALMGLDERARRKLARGQMTLGDAEAMLDLPPEKADRVLRSVGTTAFRQEVARERLETDDRAALAAELRREFLEPFLTGAQRPPRAALPGLRREVVTSLAEGLPRRVVRAWLDALGLGEPVEVHQVDPDRALLALATVVASGVPGQYDLLARLDYEPSPVEVELLEGA
ncbi:MAG: ParB N-terminal domain-containing protein [Cellulomonas sp.]|nr:ParB N-terminal domain-containing protein [Cellulomonas sp.]